MTVRSSWLQAGSYQAEDDRLLIQALLGGSPTQPVSSGVVGSNDLAVTQTGTASMVLDISVGAALIVGTESVNQGVYGLINDSVATVTISTSDATNDRIDIVVGQILDHMYSGTSDLGQIVVVKGTASGSPVAPTLPKNSVLLATVTVGHGVTSITTAHIADGRTFMPSNRDSGWISPSLVGDWANFGSGAATAGYRKIGNQVFLRGALNDVGGTGSPSTNVFTLPAGYLPVATQGFSLFTDTDSGATAELFTSGVVKVGYNGSPNFITLDNVSFFVN